MLPSIRENAINSLIDISKVSMGYEEYTQQFIDFLRKSRQTLSDDFHCVGLINGLANFYFKFRPSSTVYRRKVKSCRSCGVALFLERPRQ
jgi:hypothetical protein